MRGSSEGLAGRSLQLVLLTATLTAAVYAKVALGPLQETMRHALSLSDNQIALLQGPALAIPMVVVAVPLGLLIDRHSRVRVLFALAVMLLAGSVLTAVASGFTALLVARGLTGLAVFGM